MAETNASHHRPGMLPSDLGEIRTIMAADRTLMAWIRTSLSMLSFGFTIYKFLQAVATQGNMEHPNSPQTVGLLLTGLGVGLSLARFAFEQEIDRRCSIDAARLLSRLIRNVDFACRQDDGSILTVFADTDLRHAHVAARRLAAAERLHQIQVVGREQVAREVHGVLEGHGDALDDAIARARLRCAAFEPCRDCSHHGNR